jgi:hypothetical protein
MITRKKFREEERRIKALRKQGKSERFIKGWLRGWRLVGQANKRRS